MIAWRDHIRRLRWPLIVGGVTALGLILRLASAWAMRYSTSPDFGIVALAAKHMTEGIDYPVFFYGQAYMGVTESALAAMLCRLLGVPPTAFMAALGTALIGTLLLPLLYLCARDAGSRRAGLIAMLYCLVGSDTNFHYAVANRGSYMTLMVAGVFTLWQTGRIATRISRGVSVRWHAYLALGVAAGLGWWATQLMIVFLLSACIILLTAARPRLILGLPAAILGFVAGGLPWWLWNIRHHWGTFDFHKSVGGTAMATGLRHSWRQFLEIVELSPRTHAVDGLRLALLLAMGGLFLFLLIRDRRACADGDRFRFRLAAPILLIVMVLIHASSRFATINASRYLLPAIPAVAIMLGVGVDWLLQRIRWPLGWIVFLALLPEQIYLLPRMGEGTARDYAAWQRADRLMTTLRPLCDGVCMAPFTANWMNFATGERLCFATPPEERYAPYARRAELAVRPAFLADYLDIRCFMDYTASQGLTTNVDGTRIDYALTPPTNAWRYVAPSNVAAIEEAQTRTQLDVLQDDRIDTHWLAVATREAPATLTARFKRPVSLAGLRLLSPTDAYPRDVRIEGQCEGQATWQPLLHSETTRYFWSGTRIQLDGLQYFQEFRFVPTDPGITRVRLTFAAPSRDHLLNLCELRFMEAAPEPGLPALAFDDCLPALRTNGISRLYAPRWLEEEIAAMPRLGIGGPAPHSLTRTVADEAECESTRPTPVVFKGATGFLTDGQDTERTRALLHGAGLGSHDVAIGAHTLFVVTEADRDAVTSRAPLFWTELGCLAASHSKPQAEILLTQATAHAARGATQARLDCLQRAVLAYPSHPTARSQWIAALREAGRSAEADAQAAILNAETVPQIPAPIRFSNGIEFLGVTLTATEAAPGQAVDVTYFWRWPDKALVGQPMVFVHWERAGKRFQDDHGLLGFEWPDDRSQQPCGEVVREHLPLMVPMDTAPGEYRLTIGLVAPGSTWRLKADTDLEQRHRAVKCPAMLRVRAAP